MKLPLVGLLIAGLSASASAQAEVSTVENISSELVKIRTQIEELHAQVNQKNQLYADQLRSLSNQKTDLEVRISRSELNVKELQRELEAIASKNAASMESSRDSLPTLQAAISELRSTVEQDLPFKRVERLQALADIETRLNTHVISTNRAANQLWAYVEDELMLGKTNGIYNDTIEVDGALKLVKVLRLGKVALFYRSDDMKYGVVRKQAESWQQAALNNPAAASQLDYLFDSFSKNIRNGAFTVPNFLPQP